MVKNIFTLARGKAWISLTGFTERPIPSTFCSNNSFSTGHKCRTSKVNIRLSIDGFRDRERFYRRRTRTCRLLPVFSVFNGPSACPDLRCSSFSRAAKLSSLVERIRDRGKERERERKTRFYEHFCALSFYAFDAHFARKADGHDARFRLRVCTIPCNLDRISHLITRKNRRFRATIEREGEREREGKTENENVETREVRIVA